MISVRYLEPGDAPALAELEALYHPDTLRDGARGFWLKLTDSAYMEVNFSFGLVAEGKLVGYVLGQGRRQSQLPREHRTAGKITEVAYIDDLTILPPYRKHFSRLFLRFAQEVMDRLPGTPVEAHAIEPMIQVFRSRGRLAEKFGYDLDCVLDTDQKILGHKRQLIRWEARTPPPTPAEQWKQVRRTLDKVRFEHDGQNYWVLAIRYPPYVKLLGSVWNEICDQAPFVSAMQSHPAICAWGDYILDGRMLVLLICRDREATEAADGYSGDVIGIAPLCLRPESAAQLHADGRPDEHTAWQVQLLGNELSDGQILLASEPNHLAGLHGIQQYLKQRTALWYSQFLEFHSSCRNQSEFEAELKGQALAFEKGTQTVCLTLQRESYFSLLAEPESSAEGAGMATLRQAYDRLVTTGNPRLVTHGPETLENALQEMMNLSASESLREADEASYDFNDDDDHVRYYLRLAEGADRSPQVVVRTLYLGPKPLGMTLGILHENTFHSLYMAVDAAEKSADLLTIMRWKDMEACFEAGMTAYRMPFTPQTADHLGRFRAACSPEQETFYYCYRRNRSRMSRARIIFRWFPLLKRLWRRIYGVALALRPRS